MKLTERLGKEWVFFDGGMGTILQAHGLKAGELPETWNLSHPDEIIALNRSYFEAGCDVVNTNTFGANALKYPDNLREIVEAAVSHAKTARSLAGREEAFVALDIGPTGKLLQPIENGLPIKFTTGLHTGCTKLLVPGDSDIKSIADLKGKKIGVPGLADAATVVSKRSLSAAGIGVTEQNMEVEFSVYSRNDLPQALENGAVDAIALGDPTASIAEEQYGLTALIDTATDPKYKDEYCCNAFVTSKLAAENPKAAAAFTRAVQKASQWVQENPDETAKIIVDKQYVSGDVEFCAQILKTYNYKPSVQGGYDALKLNAEELSKIGVLKEGTDAQKFADNAYIFFDDVPDAPEASSGTTAAAPSASASSVSFTEAAEAEENDCCGGKIEKPDTTRKA